MALIEGGVFYCGDYVDTDVMAPGRFEPYRSNEDLARCSLIDYVSDPPFVDPTLGRSRYKVIIAGKEFGCGSSRETAPLGIYHAGCRAIIARSFGRIFFRNCINMGLILPIKLQHGFDKSILGAQVSIDTAERSIEIDSNILTFPDLGPLNKILEAGGLTNYTKAQKGIQ